MARYTLQQEVAEKYNCNPAFLSGQKLVFPKQLKHKVAHKPAHELTLAEVDALVAAGAVEGVFSLKVDAPAKPVLHTATGGTGRKSRAGK